MAAVEDPHELRRRKFSEVTELAIRFHPATPISPHMQRLFSHLHYVRSIPSAAGRSSYTAHFSSDLNIATAVGTPVRHACALCSIRT